MRQLLYPRFGSCLAGWLRLSTSGRRALPDVNMQRGCQGTIWRWASLVDDIVVHHHIAALPLLPNLCKGRRASISLLPRSYKAAGKDEIRYCDFRENDDHQVMLLLFLLHCAAMSSKVLGYVVST